MSAYVVIAGPPFLLVAILFKQVPLLYRVGLGGVQLGLWLSGVTVVIKGGQNLQRHRAAVYAVNHTSNVEPPILFYVLSPLFPRLRVLYKAEL